MNLDEATQLVTTAGVLYPAWWLKLDKRTQEATFAAWASMLEDVEPRAGLAALKRHAATNKWPPSIAEIRAIVAESQHGRARTGAQAWEDVRRAIGSVGRNRAPTFTDPVTALVVNGLGWVELCNSENATADRARFIDAYEQHARRAAEDRSVASLPGVARPALPDAAPVSSLVGDVAAKLRALPGGRR